MLKLIRCTSRGCEIPNQDAVQTYLC